MLNLLWFAHLVATAEVLTIGTQAGVDLVTLRRCLLASPAASNFLERDVLSVLTRGDYGDAGGEMLPIKLYEDLTRPPPTPARRRSQEP